ncbi:site-specific integrase [Clostridium saccharobutylicum]|uniref:Tyrosine recombinase XerD n=1 Tax=Clostridium saccharobutylicum TaxID=169679 RepID=A0A1S8NJU6_CLOSA|nr:site-specific integrase [Clostridium saccharobutylicum]OOM16755.1 tyrosine recombinase XerD [Clostridium saccharobutylicum]
MAYFKNIGTKNKPNWIVEGSFGTGKDGKRLRIKRTGFRTQKEAEAFLNEYANNVNKGNIKVEAKNIIFGDFIAQWFNEHKSRTLSINTRTNYKSRIDTHIIPYLGRYKLTEIDTLMVQNFYNTLIGQGLKASSVKKIIETLNNCFKYAVKMRLIAILPTDIEKIPVEKPKIEYWNKDQVDFFLDEIKKSSLFTPIFIDMLTGLRVAELCGLRWRDVDLDNGTIEVNGQVIFDRINKVLVPTEILKTDTSHRKISIPNILVEHLRAIKEEEKPQESNFVIQDRYGLVCNPRNVSMRFTKAIAKYKKSIDEIEKETGQTPTNYMKLPQITFHGLRHTHATLLISNGENIKVVSERLGHSDIATTLNTYTHVMDESKEKTASLLDEMFKKS